MFNHFKLDNAFYLKHHQFFNLFIIILILLTYFFIPYHLYRIDDAWFAAFIYNDYIHNIRTDTVFGGDINTGAGGTQLFLKIYATVYGHLIDFLFLGEWTKENLHFISKIFVSLALVVWYFIFLHFKFDKLYALIMVFSLSYMDIFVSTAHYVRTEAFILFFISISLWMALSRKYMLSLLFSFIAIETHPVGVVSLFMNLSVLFDQTHRQFILTHLIKITSHLIIVTLFALMLYILLHYEYLPRLIELMAVHKTWPFKFLYNYYFLSKSAYRHIPELILILISFVIFIKTKSYREQPIIFSLVLSVLIFAFLLKKGLPHYTILVYPVFLLMVFYVVIKLNRLSLLIVFIILLYSPQYGLRYYKFGHYSDPDYQSALIDEVKKYHLPIIGLPNDYFILIDYEFYYLCGAHLTEKITTALLIEHKRYEVKKYTGGLCSNKQKIDDHYHKQKIKSIRTQNHSVILYKIRKL